MWFPENLNLHVWLALYFYWRALSWRFGLNFSAQVQSRCCLIPGPLMFQVWGRGCLDVTGDPGLSKATVLTGSSWARFLRPSAAVAQKCYFLEDGTWSLPHPQRVSSTSGSVVGTECRFRTELW